MVIACDRPLIPLAASTTVLNCNNTWIGEETPCLTYGMRGIVKLRLEVDGPASDLHSGLEGGVTHEPLQVRLRCIPPVLLLLG